MKYDRKHKQRSKYPAAATHINLSEEQAAAFDKVREVIQKRLGMDLSRSQVVTYLINNFV